MSDLRGNSKPVQMETGSTTKIVGALIIAAIIGGIGIYTVETGYWNPPHHQVVANNQLPSPTPGQ